MPVLSHNGRPGENRATDGRRAQTRAAPTVTGPAGRKPGDTGTRRFLRERAGRAKTGRHRHARSRHDRASRAKTGRHWRARLVPQKAAGTRLQKGQQLRPMIRRSTEPVVPLYNCIPRTTAIRLLFGGNRKKAIIKEFVKPPCMLRMNGTSCCKCRASSSTRLYGTTACVYVYIHARVV